MTYVRVNTHKNNLECFYCRFILRFFIIDQQIAWHFVQYSESYSNPLPFYASQMVRPFS